MQSSDSGCQCIIKSLLFTVGLGGSAPKDPRDPLEDFQGQKAWTLPTHEHTTPLSCPCLTIIYSVLDGGSEVSAHTSLTKPPQHTHTHTHTCTSQ